MLEMRIRDCLRRFLSEDESQDLVEYAMLAAYVGLAGAVAWLAVQAAIANGYIEFDTQEQLKWEPPDPE
jgi:Flp pilus assembly pilin Flp